MSLNARVAVFLGLTGVVLLGGHLYSGDELLVARVTESIVTRQDLSVRPIEGFASYARRDGPDGRPRTWYGVGLSFAAVPFYLAGMALEPAVPPSGLAAFDEPRILYYDRTDRAEVIRAWVTSATNPVVTGLTALALGLILGTLGLSPRVQALAALAWGLTGTTPFYAKTFFSEPLAGLLLAVALLAFLRTREPGRRAGAWAFACGLSLGAALLARVAMGAVLVPAGLAVGLEAWRRRRDGGLRQVGATALGGGIGLLLLLASNLARFGSPFETGYSGVLDLFGGGFLEGLDGLAASPGRGFLFYVPWVLPAAWGTARLARRDLPVALFCGGSFVALWLLYAPWKAWDGGWAYGPRFLVPAVPLLVVPAVLALRDAWHARWVRTATLLLALGSLACAAQSVQVNFVDYGFVAWRTEADADAALRWSWARSPLVAYWDFPSRGFILLPRLLAGHGGGLLQGVGWALAAAWVATAAGLARGLARTSPTPSGTSGATPPG